MCDDSTDYRFLVKSAFSLLSVINLMSIDQICVSRSSDILMMMAEKWTAGSQIPNPLAFLTACEVGNQTRPQAAFCSNQGLTLCTGPFAGHWLLISMLSICNIMHAIPDAEMVRNTNSVDTR